ncbi:MAG: hypothetical protein ACE5KT_11230 [Methanosarcinales archaeon]
MQPVDKKELEKLIEEAKAAGKDTSELEKMLSEGKFIEPSIGEVKEEDIEWEVWTRVEKGAKKVRRKGKVVILSTGPARKEDFE